MKVYIVTDGSYSEYMIEKVFSNRPAAEEYKKWHNITNDIEEYEIYDEPFAKEDGERAMTIRVQGIVYPEAVVDIKYDIRPTMICEGAITRGSGVSKLGHHGSEAFDIYIYRSIPADKWDEDNYKDKFTKALYDLAAIAKSMFADGATVDMVNTAFRNKDEEE